jgi:hypothetical protein
MPIVVVLVLLFLLVLGGHTVVNLVLIGLGIFGIVRSFQAHWIIGLLALIIYPAAIVIGVLSLISGKNVARVLLPR